MYRLFCKLAELILETQNKFYRLNYKYPTKLVFANSTTKTSMNSACTLKLSSKTEENKSSVDKLAKKIVLNNIKTPHKIFEYIEEKGTKIYRTQHASAILWAIGEEEGFITSLRGCKAFVLNFLIGALIEKKFRISFSTKEMFIMRNKQVDVYMLSHHFHKWLGYKMKLPGYDYTTQEKFKRIYKTLSDAEISRFSMAEVISIKEAVARNVESIDFVVNIAKEYEGAKKSLNKMKLQSGANI